MELNSKDIGLYYNAGNPSTPDWKLVACSTSDGFSGSTDNVAISNKCEGNWTKNLPGDRSWTFSNSAYAQHPAAANQISHNELFDLWAAGTVGQWKLESVQGAAQYLRIGEAWISELGETADSGDYLQFDLSLQGNGPVLNTLST